jgi:hypothetical protein
MQSNLSFSHRALFCNCRNDSQSPLKNLHLSKLISLKDTFGIVIDLITSTF